MWAEVTCSPGVSEDTYRVMVYREEAVEVSSGEFQTHYDTLDSCELFLYRESGSASVELTDNGSGMFTGQLSVAERPAEDEQFQLAIRVRETDTSPWYTLKALCVYDGTLFEAAVH